MRFHWIDIKVFTSLLTPDISFYFACCCSPVTRITKRKNCIAKECDFKSSQWTERSIPSCIWFSAGDCEVLFCMDRFVHTMNGKRSAGRDQRTLFFSYFIFSPYSHVHSLPFSSCLTWSLNLFCSKSFFQMCISLTREIFYFCIIVISSRRTFKETVKQSEWDSIPNERNLHLSLFLIFCLCHFLCQDCFLSLKRESKQIKERKRLKK